MELHVKCHISIAHKQVVCMPCRQLLGNEKDLVIIPQKVLLVKSQFILRIC